MTSAYILIAATLILGGLIAALGDHLGSKVGKARLRLFKLRPRQTAIVVTVVTGTIISASTLGILFALSESLRQGVFELDEILKKRREVKTELAETDREKQLIRQELEEARQQKIAITKELERTNHNFIKAENQLKTTTQQTEKLRLELEKLNQERQTLILQREKINLQSIELQEKLILQQNTLNEQASKIDVQNKTLAEKELNLKKIQLNLKSLQKRIAYKDETIDNLDKAIHSKDEEVKNLETQLTFLKKQVETLEQYYQNYQELREKRIALLKGQILASAALRIVDKNAAIPVIDEMLREANRNALLATGNSNSNQRLVKITKGQVEQLANQISDGQEYVVRILSAGNYVQEEAEVRVFADAVLNQEVFLQNQLIATVSLDINYPSPEEVQKRIDILLSSARFRARSAGILGDIQIENGSLTNLGNFLEKINESLTSVDQIVAVAVDNTYTVGPLKLRLVAYQDGKIIFDTRE